MRTCPTVASFPSVLAAIAFTTALLPAQCGAQWVAGSPVRGMNGVTRASAWWDADGPGPATPKLVVAGAFTAIADIAAQNLVVWDPVTDVWSPLGGMNGEVSGLLALPNGDLLAVGRFTEAGGVPCNRVARLHAGAWSPLGTGITGPVPAFLAVNAVAVMTNGDVVVAGEFATAGGQPANRIARWDGVAWSAMGAGMNGYVNTLLALPNGDLLAGGYFTTAGGQPIEKLARWNGSAWSQLGSGLGGGSSNEVIELHLLANGDVVVGGFFGTAGGSTVNGIASWNGVTWSSFGAGVIGGVTALAVEANGNLVVAVGQQSSSAPPTLRRWNGTSWSAVGPAMAGTLTDLAVLPNGDLLVSGTFSSVAGVPLLNLARWDGATFLPIRSGFDGVINAVAEMPDGSLVVAGRFSRAPNVFANSVARWHGGSWTALGDGVIFNGQPGTVDAVLAMPNGDLVVAGLFQTAGGVAAAGIARWDGSTWSSFGPGTSSIDALALLPNGELLVGGRLLGPGGWSSDIARWDGSAWQPIATSLGLQPGLIDAIAVMPNGDIVVGGSFLTTFGAPANHITRWDGSSWQQMGVGVGNSVRALALLPNGDLVAGGAFDTPGIRVARWNGSSWQPMGSGIPGPFPQVITLAALPNGDVIAGGEMSAIGPNLARWNGTTWAPLAGGVQGTVNCVFPLRNGTIAVAGQFLTVGAAGSQPTAASDLAALLPGCPAQVSTFGSGCSGSGGMNVLAASSLPWLGSTFRAQATGMPANGLAVAAFGFGTTSTPLANVLPQGVAGCDLLVTADVLELMVPTAGVVTSQLVIPNATSLIGVVLHEQVVPIELGAGGVIVAVTSSNGLSLALGAL